MRFSAPGDLFGYPPSPADLGLSAMGWGTPPNKIKNGILQAIGGVPPHPPANYYDIVIVYYFEIIIVYYYDIIIVYYYC